MIDRARQFSPFSPLKGFYKKILEKEKVVVPKHEMLDGKAQDLSYKLNMLECGLMVKVIYYHEGEYLKKEGIISKIDFDNKKLRIVMDDIYFEDIWDIECEEKNIEQLF